VFFCSNAYQPGCLSKAVPCTGIHGAMSQAVHAQRAQAQVSEGLSSSRQARPRQQGQMHASPCSGVSACSRAAAGAVQRKLLSVLTGGAGFMSQLERTAVLHWRAGASQRAACTDGGRRSH